MNPDRKPDAPAELPAPRPAPDPLADELNGLVELLRDGTVAAGRPAAARRRLLERVARSAAASRTLHTLRRKDTPVVEPAPGVRLRRLYEARPGALRPGEPRRVSWIELAPGTRWLGPRGGWPADGLQRDWLVVRGRARVGAAELAELDYHVVPGHLAVPEIASETGATLYLREAPRPPEPDTPARTDRARQAEWSDFAPGIKRRLLWQRDGEAAMLYHALPGAGVPQHGHRRDEECLMLQGELFLDEVLLREGEYQIAPAGTGHVGVQTDTGVMLYAHGDLELDVVAA